MTGKVIGIKGERNIYSVSPGNEKDTITVLLTVRADGILPPPMVVFPYIKPPRTEPTTDKDKPVLFLIDEHSSHMSKELSQACEQHNIILYALPANTTHILQPCDVTMSCVVNMEKV